MGRWTHRCDCRRRTSAGTVGWVPDDFHTSERLLLTTREVCEMLAVSKATFYRRLRHADGFPDPVVVGERCVRWPAAAVTQWVEERTRRDADLLGVRPGLLRHQARGPARRRR